MATRKPARRLLPEGTISATTPTGLPAAKRPTGVSVVPSAAQAGGPARKGRGVLAQGDATLATLGAQQGLLQSDRNALVNGRANGTLLPGGTASAPRSAPRTTPRRRGR